MDDYLTLMHELSGEYTNMMLTNFDYMIDVYGTDVLVKRSSVNEMREALGSAYIFDGDSLAEAPQQFKSRLVINRSQLLDRYKTTVQDIEAWINRDDYRIGDQIELKVNGFLIRYKVSNIEIFDPYGIAILFKLTLSGFEEYKIT